MSMLRIASLAIAALSLSPLARAEATKFAGVLKYSSYVYKPNAKLAFSLSTDAANEVTPFPWDEYEDFQIEFSLLRYAPRPDAFGTRHNPSDMDAGRFDVIGNVTASTQAKEISQNFPAKMTVPMIFDRDKHVLSVKGMPLPVSLQNGVYFIPHFVVSGIRRGQQVAIGVIRVPNDPEGKTDFLHFSLVERRPDTIDPIVDRTKVEVSKSGKSQTLKATFDYRDDASGVSSISFSIVRVKKTYGDYYVLDAKEDSKKSNWDPQVERNFYCAPDKLLKKGQVTCEYELTGEGQLLPRGTYMVNFILAIDGRLYSRVNTVDQEVPVADSSFVRAHLVPMTALKFVEFYSRTSQPHVNENPTVNYWQAVDQEPAIFEVE